MSDNTINTSQNLGILHSTQTFNDFVGTSDLYDYYRFELSSNSNFNLTINGSYYGLDLYRDVNNNTVIDAGETMLSTNPSGSLSVFSGLNVSSINNNNNGNLTRNISLSGSLNTGTYYVRVYSSGSNTNYTMRLGASPGQGNVQNLYADQVLYGTNGNDNLFSSFGNDSLYGFDGNDNLFSGSGNDYLNGSAGNDNLNAGSGNDYIDGGTGNDNINGGSGEDIAVFSSASTNYSINMNGSTGTVSGTDGIDFLTSIEGLQFADKFIDLFPNTPPITTGWI